MQHQHLTIFPTFVWSITATVEQEIASNRSFSSPDTKPSQFLVIELNRKPIPLELFTATTSLQYYTTVESLVGQR